MKILFNNMISNLDGCMLYRNIIPFEALSGMGHEIQFLPCEEDFDPDIVFFSRHYGKGIEKVVETIKSAGKKIVYECDDLIDSVSSDNPFSQINNKDFIHSFKYLLREADLIITTTDYLKSEMSKRTDKRIEVIPNAVREFVPRPNNEGLRIGYVGGNSHYKDLDFILDIILDLQKDYDFEFITMGVGQEKSFEQFKGREAVYKYYQSSNEKIKKLKKYKYQSQVSPLEYQQTVSDLDLTIGLCPLQDNKFSRCKSSVKYYEYASVGTVTLASDVEAYKDCNYTAKRYWEWKTKLKRLIEDKSFRDGVLNHQMNYILEHRTIDVVKDKWNEVLSTLDHSS